MDVCLAVKMPEFCIRVSRFEPWFPLPASCQYRRAPAAESLPWIEFPAPQFGLAQLNHCVSLLLKLFYFLKNEHKHNFCLCSNSTSRNILLTSTVFILEVIFSMGTVQYFFCIHRVM